MTKCSDLVGKGIFVSQNLKNLKKLGLALAVTAVTGGLTTSVWAAAENVVGGGRGVALGNGSNASVSSEDSIAIGEDARAAYNQSIAIGKATSVAGNAAVAIGTDAKAHAMNAIAIGNNAFTDEKDAIAIGTGTVSHGALSISMGQNAYANGYAVAIGDNTSASDTKSVALGTKAKAEGPQTIAIGSQANAKIRSSIAIGDQATTTGDVSMALGALANASAVSSVALGWESVADRAAGSVGYDPLTGQNSNLTSATWKSVGGAVSVGQNGQAGQLTRQIINVAAGTEDTDAVNVAQLKNVAKLAKDAGNANLKFTGNTGTGTVNLASQNLNITGDGNVTTAATTAGITVGLSKDIKAKIDSITPIKYMSVNSTLTDATLPAKDRTAGKISNADNNGATGANAIAIGPVASAAGESAVALGRYVVSGGKHSVAIGNEANTIEAGSVVIGYKAKAVAGPRYKDGVINPDQPESGQDGVAIGYYAQTIGLGAAAVGKDARAKVEGAAAFGYSSYALNLDSVAVGRGANAKHDGGVALGAYSVTNRAAGEKLGYDPLTNADSTDESVTWKSTLGAVSVGSVATKSKAANTRQITNLAAGTDDTDAVNVAQLKKVVSLANGAAAAAGDVTLNINGDNSSTGAIKLKDTPLAITGDGTIVTNATDAGISLSLDSAKLTSAITGAVGDKLDKIDKIMDPNGNLKLNVKSEDGISVRTDKDGNTVVGLDDKVSVGQVAIDGKDGKGAITGLTNTTWDPSNIQADRAATEGQLKGLADTVSGIGTSLNTEEATIGGNTTINKDGITVKNPNGEGSTKITGDSVTTGTVNADKVVVGGNTYISENGLNAGNKTITDVAPGIEGTDAVNMNQLNEVKQGVNNVSSAVNRLSNRVDKVAAGSAALAALHPLDFDSDDKLNFAVGFGGYKGEHAAALGAFYRANDDLMFSLVATIGNSNDQYNAGVSFRFGDSSPYTNMSKSEMANTLEKQNEEIETLKDRLAKLEALVAQK